MELDYDKADQKKKEIVQLLSSYIQKANIAEPDSAKIAEIIESVSISISPPEKKKVTMHLVTMTPSGRGGGRSTKPGNIRLNIRSLIESIASGAFAIVSTYQTPWLAPFAFLLLWNSLWNTSSIDLSENEATVLWTMWAYRDRNNNEIAENNLLERVNELLQKYSRALISQKDLDIAIRNLEEIESIEKTGNYRTSWYLCEWIRTSY